MGQRTDIHEVAKEAAEAAVAAQSPRRSWVMDLLENWKVVLPVVALLTGTNVTQLVTGLDSVTREQSGAAATAVANIWEAQYSECEASKDRLARMHAICVESMAAFSPSAHMLGGAVMEAAPPPEE